MYCYNLTHIVVSPEHPVLEIIDGVLFDKAEKKLLCYPKAFTQDSYVIPGSVTGIGDGAFYSCNSLTSLTLPDSVTNIGTNPFEGCSNLTRIVVSPEHPALATINGVLLDKTEKKLICYPCAFSESRYVIPTGITSIGDGAFSSCKSLTSITLPDGVTSIGDGAFAECDSLTSITIPDSVTNIAGNAFQNCSKVLTFTVSRNSWAAEWCKENGLNYTYPDALDWLNS